MKTVLPFIFLFVSLQISAQDTIIDVHVNGLSLCGALTLPEPMDTCFQNSDTCFVCDSLPLVIMIHDEGRWNYNEDIIVSGGFQQCFNPDLIGHHLSIFKDIAEDLAARGIASFRYCKRTYLYGNDVLDPETLSPYDFISDGAAVTGEVKKIMDNLGYANIKIYLLGHGQGVDLLPGITDSLKNVSVSGYIGLNGSAVGVDTTRAQFVQRVYETCLNNFSAGQVAYDTVLSTYAKIRSMDYPYDQNVVSTLPLNQTLDLGKPYFSEAWMQITDTFLEKYSQYDLPSLFINGQKDAWVNPRSHQIFPSRLDLTDGTFLLADGVKHLLVTQGGYRVDKGVTTSIADWIWSYCDTLVRTTGTILPKAISDCMAFDPVHRSLQLLFTPTQHHLVIVDMTGRTVFYQKTPNSIIGLSDLPTGVYVAHLLDDGGQRCSIKLQL